MSNNKSIWVKKEVKSVSLPKMLMCLVDDVVLIERTTGLSSSIKDDSS